MVCFVSVDRGYCRRAPRKRNARQQETKHFASSLGVFFFPLLRLRFSHSSLFVFSLFFVAFMFTTLFFIIIFNPVSISLSFIFILFLFLFCLYFSASPSSASFYYIYFYWTETISTLLLLQLHPRLHNSIFIYIIIYPPFTFFSCLALLFTFSEVVTSFVEDMGTAVSCLMS